MLRELLPRPDSCCTKVCLIVPFLQPTYTSQSSSSTLLSFPLHLSSFYSSIPFSLLPTLTLPFSFLYIPPQRLPAHFSSPFAPSSILFPLIPHVPLSHHALLPPLSIASSLPALPLPSHLSHHVPNACGSSCEQQSECLNVCLTGCRLWRSLPLT